MSQHDEIPNNDEDKWLKFYSRSLCDLADLGEGIYRKIFEMEEFKAPNILPAVNYFKNFVEIIDSVSVNVEKGITTAPTRVLIRAATEYFFSLMYLFEDRKSLELKSLAISFCSIIEERRGYEPFFPENIKSTEVKLRSENENLGQIDLSEFDYSAKSRYFDELLGHPDFKEVKDEYLKTSKKTYFNKKKFIPWYSLWNGPLNVKELADRTFKTNIYESIYREFSHYTHGSKSFQKDFIHLDDQGYLHMYGKRTPYNLKFVSTPSWILCAELYRKVIRDILDDGQVWNDHLDNLLYKLKKVDPENEPIDISNNLVLKFPEI